MCIGKCVLSRLNGEPIGFSVLGILVIDKNTILTVKLLVCLETAEMQFLGDRLQKVRPMLSDRSLSALPSVFNVSVPWPNGWMDQDETWHGGRPRPRPHCVRWGPISPKRAQPPNFRPMSVVAKRLDASGCHMVRR